jgi:hypothetical protein
MPLRFSVEPPTDILRPILEAIAAKLNETLRKVESGLRPVFTTLIDNFLRNSPEGEDLLHGGKLQAEMGVENPEQVLRNMVEALGAAMEIEVSPARVTGQNLSGGIAVRFSRTDFTDALSADGTSFVSRPSFGNRYGKSERPQGALVEWLRWLLFRGDQDIIIHFHFAAGYPERSRTGLGIMLPKGAWHVPSEYAGTSTNNWLTRAFELGEGAITTALQRAFEGALAT